MADTFQLQVATPEHLLIDEQVREVQLPGKSGYMAILPDHAPLLSALGAGLLKYEGGSAQRSFVISGGFVEVFDNHVRVLADHAEAPDKIDTAAARHDLEEATKALGQADSEAATDAALDAFQTARAKLEAKGEHTQ
jgi:F-type H+-transporting ATPase subunit epsilon